MHRFFFVVVVADDTDELNENKTENLTILKSFKSKDDLTQVSMKNF